MTTFDPIERSRTDGSAGDPLSAQRHEQILDEAGSVEPQRSPAPVRRYRMFLGIANSHCHRVWAGGMLGACPPAKIVRAYNPDSDRHVRNTFGAVYLLKLRGGESQSGRYAVVYGLLNEGGEVTGKCVAATVSINCRQPKYHRAILIERQ